MFEMHNVLNELENIHADRTTVCFERTRYSFKVCVRFYKGHCVPKQLIRAVKTLKYSRIRIKCFVLFVFSKRDRL